MTQPEVIEAIHLQYLEAGADVIETNTFKPPGIAQADYGLQSQVHAMNVAAIACARRAVATAERRRPRSVLRRGIAIGPLNRTLSLSPDVNRPEYRAVTWNQVVAAYAEQVRALLEGGVDALLSRDHLRHAQPKAALFAIEQVSSTRSAVACPCCLAHHHRRRGRTLAGQTLEAATISIATRARSPWASTARSAPCRCVPTSKSWRASPSVTSLLPERRPAQRLWRL
jgi:5-methyltetrahydrofolate--homocysteine methyltransferase